MKTITIGEKKINLNIGDELTVRELRRVYPLISKYADNDIELIIQVVIALSDNEKAEEVVESLNQKEFAELSKQIGELLDTKKK